MQNLKICADGKLAPHTDGRIEGRVWAFDTVAEGGERSGKLEKTGKWRVSVFIKFVC
jgi:hypothetical protein